MSDVVVVVVSTFKYGVETFLFGKNPFTGGHGVITTTRSVYRKINNRSCILNEYCYDIHGTVLYDVNKKAASSASKYEPSSTKNQKCF